MGLFDNVLLRFQELGVFHVLFPAVLIFLLAYAALLGSGVFKSSNNPTGFSALTSLIIAILLVTQTQLVAWIIFLLPQGAFLLVIGLLIFLVLGFAQFEGVTIFGVRAKTAFFVLLAMVIGAIVLGWPFIGGTVGSIGRGVGGVGGILASPDLWAFIILAAIFILVFKMVSGKGGGSTGAAPKP